MKEDSSKDRKATDFAKLGEDGPKSAVGELFAFLGESKKWWLLPIIIAVLILGAFIILAGTGAAPFIYSLF